MFFQLAEVLKKLDHSKLLYKRAKLELLTSIVGKEFVLAQMVNWIIISTVTRPQHKYC